jgi:bifunctional DNase/RNase
MEHEAEIEGIGVGVGEDGGRVPAVILAARDEYLPIFITGDQARSIELAMTGEPSERPLTHDLLVDMMTELSGVIDKVRIDDLTDGTFYAKVDLVRYENGEPDKFVFDARPSDGLALAVRVGCPITVTDEVLDDAGRDPEELESPDDPPFPGGGHEGTAGEADVLDQFEEQLEDVSEEGSEEDVDATEEDDEDETQ